MKEKPILWMLLFILLLSFTACNYPRSDTPSPQVLFPTLSIQDTPTAMLMSPTTAPSQTAVAFTTTPALPTSTPPKAAATATLAPAAISKPGTPSGPYAVILVEENDVLNIRMGPGINYPIVGTFLSSATNVQWTGESAIVSDTLWVEVERKNNRVGWVNANYLTEYVTPDAFCQDSRVTTLLDDFKKALNNADGRLFSSMISPLHGLELYYWRFGPSANYTAVEASWVFNSTYEVNWGAGASGLDDIGTFREVPLPKLLEVINDSNYEQQCNDASTASMYLEPWPKPYANVNFYTLYKPGTPNVDLDWQTWLAGVEYVGGKLYLFSLIHFQWEP
jgi:hypothetical protein